MREEIEIVLLWWRNSISNGGASWLVQGEIFHRNFGNLYGRRLIWTVFQVQIGPSNTDFWNENYTILEQLGEHKIEEKEAIKKKYSVPSYERRDTFAIWLRRPFEFVIIRWRYAKIKPFLTTWCYLMFHKLCSIKYVYWNNYHSQIQR